MFYQTENKIYYTKDGIELAKITFTQTGNILNVDHTFVDPILRGQGIASQLVQKVVEYAILHQFKLNPICWYVEEWLEKHPEYLYLKIEKNSSY